MQWYSGDIGSAVNLAKAKNAIFVVFCSGKDENSKILTNYINDEQISSRLTSESFVSIKIESDQQEYIQFCKIYQLVPVPSLFFIKNGIPIKVITSAAKSVKEIVDSIDSIVKSAESSGPSSSASFIREEVKSAESSGPSSSASFIREEVKSAEENLEAKIAAKKKEVKFEEPEVECKDGVCYKKEPEKSVETTSEVKSESVVEEETEEERQEKIKRAMKLIEEKRIERIKEEERLEKEREIRRRKEGQELQKLKQWQDDQELQQLKDERKREKLEALEARRRVLEQIEEDKKERARRFNITQPTTEPEVCQKPKTPEIPPSSPTSSLDSAKIQFKKPDGEAEIVTFDATMVFGDIHSFVQSDLLQGTNIKDFILATTFPRREFTSEDFGKTLLELNLAPSSVLLIIPGKKSSNNFSATRGSSVLPTNTDGSFFKMISALFMGLISPVFAVFAYIKGFVFRTGTDNSDSEAGKRKRNEETLMANDAAKRRNMRAFNQTTEPSTSDAQTGAIPKPGTYKRVNPSSNIHRLHQDSDSEDERKTYNGNSTQQM